MSTTFGIVIKNKELLDLPPQENGLILPIDITDEDEVEIIYIAFRSSWGMIWKNSLAKLLPDDIKVYPLDNTPQGIYTIKDIKDEIQNQ